MRSLTSLINNHEQSPSWTAENLVAGFTQLATSLDHTYFAHVPRLDAFPSAEWFLVCEGTRKIWEEGDLRGGVELFALKLDREWPEWAANTTNVLGILFHSLLDDVYPWLDTLPANTGITNTLLFEKYLFLEAQKRHTREWWRHNHKSKPAACFKPAWIGGGNGIVMAAHPVNSGTGHTIGWRTFFQLEANAHFEKRKANQEKERERAMWKGNGCCSAEIAQMFSIVSLPHIQRSFRRYI